MLVFFFLLECLGMFLDVVIQTEFSSIKAGLRNAIPSPPWFGLALVQRCDQEYAVAALWQYGNC